MPRREGAFLVEDYFVNQGGLNTSDSPFLVQPGESTGGYNYDLQIPGAIRKRGGHVKLNSVANTQLKTLGLGLWNKPDTARQPIRCAGTKWQAFDPAAHTFTNLSEDTASAGTDFLNNSSTQPVVFSMFNQPSSGVLWGAGGGMSSIYGAYSATKVTANGVPAPTVSSFTGVDVGYVFTVTSANATVGATYTNNGQTFTVSSTIAGATTLYSTGTGAPSASGTLTKSGGTGDATITFSAFTVPSLIVGYYTYTLVYRKASTAATSNGLATTSDIVVHVTEATAGGAFLSWTYSNVDTTKYDKTLIYRSSVTSSASGSQGFTAGTLIKTLNIGTTTYYDDGSAEATSQNVPRAGNTILDNSVLPTQTFRPLTTFKRRLVTAYGSTVVFSDINKPESWPFYQTITVPSGGEITALGIISLTSPLSTDTDEALVVFKQSETWVITGTGDYSSTVPDWTLKFLISSGAINQAQVIQAEGYLSWVNYKGFYMWNGAGKPVRVSRKIWDKFQQTGDIDKSKLSSCFGFYSQKRNEVQWYLSSATYGEQVYCLKLDMTHTVGKGDQDGMGHGELDGVFLPDTLATAVYAGMAFLLSATSTEETIYLGDGAGFIFSAFSDTGDGTGSTDIIFSYPTGYLNCGSPNAAKRYHKVIAWVLDNGVYDMKLNYWSDYRYTSADASSMVLASDPNPTTGNGIWDSGEWDSMLWDAAPNKPRALTYNLQPSKNNTEGDCIRLEFQQTGSDETPVIYGFSVYYSELPLRK